MSVHTKVDKTPGGQMARDRYAELKRILDERRREILSEVHDKIRDVRTEAGNSPSHGVFDAAETSESDIQDDIEFALIQMKAETLHKIEEALRRLEEGTFGYCFECGDEISERRLRALPFALRCKDCEEARELAQQRERHAEPPQQLRRSSSTSKVKAHAVGASFGARRRATCYSLAGSGVGSAPFSVLFHRHRIARGPAIAGLPSPPYDPVRRDDAPYRPWSDLRWWRITK